MLSGNLGSLLYGDVSVMYSLVKSLPLALIQEEPRCQLLANEYALNTGKLTLGSLEQCG